MEYVTKKVPKNIVKRLQMLKARFSLRQKRNVTEGEVIAMGLARLEEEAEKTHRKTLKGLVGMIEGGEPSDEEDIDRVLYGD
jgi:hypothetical protein